MVNAASSSQATLQAGIEAMQQERYAEAIPMLRSWCDAVGEQHPHYPTAIKVLIRAHEASQEWEAAIALCRSLSDHPNEALKHWSWKKLPALEKLQPIEGPGLEFVTLDPVSDDQTAFQVNNATPTGHTRQDRKRLDQGLAALEVEKYGKAVKHLEAYLKQIQFANAKPHTHIALARAYWGNRQNQAAINLTNHLAKTGDKGTQRWCHQFLTATKHYPKARDPLDAERRARANSKVFRWDITEKLIVVAVHLSIYGGLLLAPLIPRSLWGDLGQALMHQGTVTPELIKPLALAVTPVLFPFALFKLSKERELKSHGREVVNYWVTMLAIAILTTCGTIWLDKAVLLLERVPLVLNLIKLAMAVAAFSYGIAPLAAIAWFFMQPTRIFRYPFILRLI